MKSSASKPMHVVFIVWCAWCAWAAANLYRGQPIDRTEIDYMLPLWIAPSMMALAGWYGWRVRSNIVRWVYPSVAMVLLLIVSPVPAAIESGPHLFWKIMRDESRLVELAVYVLPYAIWAPLGAWKRRRAERRPERT
jgi:hypothetical protein